MSFRRRNQTREEEAIFESAPVIRRPLDETDWLARILSPIAAFMIGGFFIAFLEVIRFVWNGFGGETIADIGMGQYLGYVFVISILAAIVNHLPIALGVAATVSRPRWRHRLGLIAAGVFAAFWHSTVMQGDGIRAHALYSNIYFGSLILVMAAVVGFVHLLILPGTVSIKLRRYLIGATSVGALLFNNLVLQDYVMFHGYLVACEVMLVAWLIYPWVIKQRKPAIKAVPIVVGLLSISALLTTDGAAPRYVQRYSHLPRSLSLAFLPSRLLLTKQSDISGSAYSTKSLSDTMPEALQRAHATIDEQRIGRNVLLIVLESTRADAWLNGRLTPKFHQWKRYGVYFPRAVANYPATPLAYGAMFTSQPPSVLAQTPHWANPRLFDIAHDKFDYFLLSQPNIDWFDHTAITQFFIPDNVQPSRHNDAEEGLNYMREAIKQVGDNSFFGWVHLYEPHDPYHHRPEYGPQGGPAAAYATEIGYIDDHLGTFMDWFYKQSISSETLVIVIADHGEGIRDEIDGAPFWGHHVHVHNILSTVPAYFSGPQLPLDSMRLRLDISQIDVMPTILDFIGEKPATTTYPQGWSLYKILDHEPERPLVTQAFSIRGKKFFDLIGKTRTSSESEDLDQFGEIFVGESYSPKLALQYGSWKLHYDVTLERFKLYNIDEDPWEQEDLADSHPTQLAEMVEQLRDWQYQQRWVVDAFDKSAAERKGTSK